MVMKNTDEQLNDPFLKDLFRDLPLESPGPDFVSNVMAGIQPTPSPVRERKPFFLQLQAGWPYALAGVLLVIFFMTSDLPISRFIPGKEYFTETLVPRFFSFFGGFFDLVFANGNVQMVLIGLSAGLFLFLLDRFLFRRFSAMHLFSF